MNPRRGDTQGVAGHGQLWLAIAPFIGIGAMLLVGIGGADPAAAGAEPAVQEAEAAPMPQVRVERAAGSWAVPGMAETSEGRTWSMAALRSGDELTGRVDLVGVPQLGGANLEARLSGRGVVGKLLDDDGQIVATFQGKVSRIGASGTFEYVGGGTGTWRWDAPPDADAKSEEPTSDR